MSLNRDLELARRALRPAVRDRRGRIVEQHLLDADLPPLPGEGESPPAMDDLLRAAHGAGRPPARERLAAEPDVAPTISAPGTSPTP